MKQGAPPPPGKHARADSPRAQGLTRNVHVQPTPCHDKPRPTRRWDRKEAGGWAGTTRAPTNTRWTHAKMREERRRGTTGRNSPATRGSPPHIAAQAQQRSLNQRSHSNGC
eukprot:10706931-Alexandrium_andersonii.AAC.1